VLVDALRIERLLSNLASTLGKPEKGINPASTLRILAIVKMNLKLFDEARVAGEGALDIHIRLSGGESLDVAQSLIVLGDVFIKFAGAKRSWIESAQFRLRRFCVHGLEKSPQFNGQQGTATLEGLSVEHNSRVRVMLYEGNILALKKRDFKVLLSNPTSAEILAEIKTQWQSVMELVNQSISHYRQAHSMLVRIVGVKHQTTIQSSKSLGYALQMTGKPLETTEACELYRRAIQIQRKLGSDDDSYFATLRWHLQTAVKSVAEFDEHGVERRECNAWP